MTKKKPWISGRKCYHVTHKPDYIADTVKQQLVTAEGLETREVPTVKKVVKPITDAFLQAKGVIHNGRVARSTDKSNRQSHESDKQQTKKGSDS